MPKTRPSAALIVALVLRLLPVIYLASCYALVDSVADKLSASIDALVDGELRTEDYRFGGKAASAVYWPLEQIDRRLRPCMWVQKNRVVIEYIEGLDTIIHRGPSPKSDPRVTSERSKYVAEQMELFKRLQQLGAGKGPEQRK